MSLPHCCAAAGAFVNVVHPAGRAPFYHLSSDMRRAPLNYCPFCGQRFPLPERPARPDPAPASGGSWRDRPPLASLLAPLTLSLALGGADRIGVNWRHGSGWLMPDACRPHWPHEMPTIGDLDRLAPGRR